METPKKNAQEVHILDGPSQHTQKKQKNTEDTDQDTNMSIPNVTEAEKNLSPENSEGFNEGLCCLGSLDDSLHNPHMNLDAEGLKHPDYVMPIIPSNTTLPLMILPKSWKTPLHNRQPVKPQTPINPL